MIKNNRRIHKLGQLIAVTGGIGSGKSFILQCFRKLGFQTYSFDDIVTNIYKNGESAYEQIALAFPDCVTEYEVDKKLLAQKVFSNKEDLIRLEAIVHPILQDKFLRFIQQRKQYHKYTLIVEIPLLFESTYKYDFDLIISAIVHPAIQKNRVTSRNNMTIAKFNAIVARQTTNDYRTQHSDFIINTGFNKKNTFKQIKFLVYGKYKRSSIRY